MASKSNDSGPPTVYESSGGLSTSAAAPEANQEGQWNPPEEFDGYLLKGCIGKGAIGRVYRAYDPALDRALAIKFIDAVNSHWYRQERFVVEARAAARIHHPNVVAIYRIGEVDGHPYIATELIRGDRLDEIPRPVSSERVLRIAVGLARGLAAAHRGSVLHRDIKPGNVIVTESSEVKILDFGLAKLLEGADPALFIDLPPSQRSTDDKHLSTPLTPEELEQTRELEVSSIGSVSSSDLSQHGSVVGTPGFIAPEVWQGEGATFRSDVYSVGAVLYRLCTGRPPYEGRTLEQLRDAAVRNEVKPISERCELEPRLAAVIHRCLNADPNLRYTNADELREALERLMPDRRDAALPEGNPYRGLRPFDPEHRALFFGRDVEIRAILERLRSSSFVFVAGNSGVGKSSLSRAGLIPRICEGALDEKRWACAPLTPGRRPILSFATALAPHLDMDEEALAELLERDYQDFYRHLRRRVKSRGPLLIFIDQLEELITLSSEAEREIIARLLEAFSSPCEGLRALATVRADFLVRVASIPGMEEPVREGMYLLKPMTAENVRKAIVGPAGAKGVTFESAEMVQRLLESTVNNEGALPLLQFALAELWDARDVYRSVIPVSALEERGGVTGALARHADGVLALLPPGQRGAARRILALLVTLDGTRTRQTENELGAEAPDRKEALSALVQGRLLMATESPEGPVYEVSHEALITSWPTLRRWLEEDAEKRALHERLATSIAEWERLGRKQEGLWSSSQLAEAARLESAELVNREREFIESSRRAVRIRRRVMAAAAGAVLLALLGTYTGMRFKAEHDRGTQVAGLVREASTFLAQARERNREVERLRREAYVLFDGRQLERGEELWERSRRLSGELAASEEPIDPTSEKHLYEQASQSLEAALALGRDSAVAKSLLADVLYERALVAERSGKADAKSEALDRMRLYDDGSRRRKWDAPGKVDIEVEPAGASVEVQRYRDRKSQNPALVLESLSHALTTPVHGLELPQGSYLLTFTAPDRAKVNLPLLVTRAQGRKVSFEMPLCTSIPEGFIYVPPGKFLFGTAMEGDQRKDSLRHVPLHEVAGPGFLIAQYETTFGEWLEYLNSLDRAEMQRRAAAFEGKDGPVSLTPLGHDWLLKILLMRHPHELHLNEPFLLPDRTTRQHQNWQRLPVLGAAPSEISRFLSWLDGAGRPKGARLCTELEWERAARGADGREYPHGNYLAANDANFALTYGKASGVNGPDEVGSHPASRSPFGLDDMAGNAAELTQSSFVDGEYVMRGASFSSNRFIARANRRDVVLASYANVTTGFRVCADAPKIP